MTLKGKSINNFSKKDINEYTVLAIGFSNWWGSDPRALAQSLRKVGTNLIELDSDDFISWRWNGILLKILRKLFIKIFVSDYNKSIINQANNSKYDFILVFKGMYIKESTLIYLRGLGKPIYNFYPDVSFIDHGSYIPRSLQYYDCIFTTKSFHGKKEIEQFNIREFIYIRHGYDPEVHRPVKLSQEQLDYYGCDISFVGCWSQEKEDTILNIILNRKHLKVYVYGIGWNKASKEFKEQIGKNLRPSAFGDELSIIYNSSKINLGLLSRSKTDKSVFDQITARTFQIPASKALMIHEETNEVKSYYSPNDEITLFKNNSELLLKIDEILRNDEHRKKLIKNAYERSILVPYDYTEAANKILKKYAVQILNNNA
jgi:spore maturation protein CgeB